MSLIDFICSTIILGSSSVAMAQSGTGYNSRQTYFPYGAQRTTEGSALPTDYTFTGQKNDDSTGLMFYGARYYDTTLGRFIQADTIVPGAFNPQAFNRYAYALNNPVRYIDPSGHGVCESEDGNDCGTGGGNGSPPPEPTPPPPPPPDDGGCIPDEQGQCEGTKPPADDGQPETPAETNEKQSPDSDSSQQDESCTPGSSKSCPLFPEFKLPSFLPPNWTITGGIGGALEAVLGLQGDLGFFTIASNGEIQFISLSPGGRLASGFGGSVEGFLEVTNAKSIDELKAWSVNAGVNVDFLGLGVDKVWGDGYDGWRLSEGLKGTVTVFPSPNGVPVPVPAEIHGGASYTFMAPIRFWLW